MLVKAMLLSWDSPAALALAKARQNPNLCFLQFCIGDLFAETKARLFPDPNCTVRIHFVDIGPLACVCSRHHEADIFVHQVLNHDQTPAEVMAYICTHELLHLRIPNLREDGRAPKHSPEFWRAEEAIAPGRDRAWSWIWSNLGRCLKRRPRLERIDVLPSWKHCYGQKRIDIENFESSSGDIRSAPALEIGW